MQKQLQTKDSLKKQDVKVIHRNQYSFVYIKVRCCNERKDPIKITTKKMRYLVINLRNVQKLNMKKLKNIPQALNYI